MQPFFTDVPWTPEQPWTMREGGVPAQKESGEVIYWRAYGIYFGEERIAIALDPECQRAAFLVEAANEKQKAGGHYPPATT